MRNRNIRRAQIARTLRARYRGLGSRGAGRLSLWRYGIAARGEPRTVSIPVPDSTAALFL